MLSHEILRRDFERISRILIIRLRSLGDSILALPLIEALRAWKPDLELDVLVEAPFAAVFSRHPAVRETLLVRPRNHASGQGWSRHRTCFEIRRRHYDAVVNLHGGSTSLLFTATSGAPIRIGQQKYRHAWAYNARIPAPPSVWQRADLHTVEDQLTLLPWLGIPVPDKPRGRLHLDDDARAHIHKRLEAAGVEPSNYVLIHPTATQASKQWKEASFAALADRLEKRHSFPVIFSAAPHEGQVLLDIGRHARHARRYWCDLGLADLFALIAGCRLFIGNDSGPTHAAAALGKSLVVIWGSSDFRAWHPWGTTCESVRSDLPCMPCPGYTCAAFGQPKCIDDIPVETVEHACDRFLGPVVI